ncbi:unnamed protein product, partial [Brenthis ino]
MNKKILFLSFVIPTYILLDEICLKRFKTAFFRILKKMSLWSVFVYFLSVNCLGGVVASMYGCTSGSPGFESPVGPSLVIESFYLVILNNSLELRSRWYCTPVPRIAHKTVCALALTGRVER